MEETILQPPEIVNPYNLGSRNSKDYALVNDLSLGKLLGSVPFSSSTRFLAEQVIMNLDSDSETVNYRQDALEELVKNSKLRKTVKEVISGMKYVQGKLRNLYSSDLASGLDLLRTYRDFMQNLSYLENVQSEAISNANNYLKQVKASGRFYKMCEFIDKIEGLGGVDFRVTLDESGSPLNMSALELVEKEDKPRKSFFEKIFGNKQIDESQEGNLRNNWGLNDLGKIIKNYLNEEFTSVIREYVPQIKEITKLIEPLEFYSGFSDYFAQLREKGFDISRPTLLPQEERRMSVENARNPLLMESRNNGHKVVPNGIDYNGDKNVFVITGPNNGGKTTYVKTVGLVQLMAQSGLFVPAKSAEVSFTDGIYTHFIAPDDITKGEGRYRNELRRMKEIFERATPYSLIILDEPCGGTSYEEGQRQSLVLLDGFHKLGSATYFTTHMHPLTREVDNGRYPAGRNFQVECIDEGEKLKYTYRIIPCSSGKSYGEEIAREIGLRPENISEIVSSKAEERGYKKLLR